MSNPVHHLRAKVTRLESMVDSIAEDEAALMESIRKIDVDLSNTLAEFVATTGRSEEEFYGWRRKAKQARHYKYQAALRKRADLSSVRQELTNAQMLLYAAESGYRGEDEKELLRALYHLVMEILNTGKYKIDEHQLGLIAAVRDRTERKTEGVVR